MTLSGLLKTAMLGTNRSAVLGAAPAPELQSTWQALSNEENPAIALLKAAAIEHIYYQAGVSALAVEPPQACLAETKPYVPSAAADAFVNLNQDSYTRLTREWIEVANTLGFIATPRLLPDLLALGALNSDLRPAISVLVGNRGLWLANLENKWPWLIASPDSKLSDAQWKTGTPAQRCQWLQVQLTQDPQLAANAIAASWPGDSPETRELFMQLVVDTPDACHEEWLQKYALTDRRQSIRNNAVCTLMSIENSGYRQRSLARARVLILTNKKLLRKQKIECQPPASFDPQWKSDGLREKPPSGTGPKDYWLFQILSVIPLRDWPQLTGHENPLALEIDSDWSATVVKAWQQAALTHPDTKTVQPLLERLSSTGAKNSKGKNDNSSEQLSKMVAIVMALDADKVADVLEPLSVTQNQCLELLNKTLPSLSIEKHPRLHKVVSDWVFKKNQLSKAQAISLAGCCDRDAIEGLLERISKVDELTASAEEFSRTLEYRQKYLKHFEHQPAAGNSKS